MTHIHINSNVLLHVQHLHFDYFEKWDYSHWKLGFCNLWWENCSSFQWDKYVAIIVSERFDVTRLYWCGSLHWYPEFFNWYHTNDVQPSVNGTSCMKWKSLYSFMPDMNNWLQYTEIFHQIDNFEFHVQKICDLQINKGFVYLRPQNSNSTQNSPNLHWLS